MIEFRIEGGIFGHLIGDALATRYLRQDKLSKSNLLQSLARSYSDAGAMTLCTMSSILEFGDIDIDEIAYTFQEWYLGSYLATSTIRGTVTISQALRLYGNGMPADKCGSKDKKIDNSALIRMLPIALWLMFDKIEDIISKSHHITLLTNQQIPAQVYSALYCLIVRGIILQKEEKTTDLLTNYYQQNNMEEYIKALKQIQKDKKTMLQGTDEVHDCFWSSWDAFSNQDSFEDVIALTLMCKDVGASSVAGSLAGMDLGINEIPSFWIDQLDLSEEAKKIIHKFKKAIIKKQGII